MEGESYSVHACTVVNTYFPSMAYLWYVIGVADWSAILIVEYLANSNCRVIGLDDIEKELGEQPFSFTLLNL